MHSDGDDSEPDIPFEADVVVTIPETGEELSAYISRGDRPLLKRFRYEVGVVITRPEEWDRTTVYASSLEREPGNEPELLTFTPELESRLAAALIVYVPLAEFFEQLPLFSGAIVWHAIDTDEMVTYYAVGQLAVEGFRKQDFPGFEVEGAVVPAHVLERE